MDTADRNYVEAIIDRARHETNTARAIAASFGLVAAVERLTWAVDFIDVARGKLPLRDRNPDGTLGPERITDEGVELGPTKG